MRIVSFVAAIGVLGNAGPAWAGEAEWSVNATIIDGCSCHIMCPCIWAGAGPPGDHAGHKFCEFSMAIKVNKGRYNTTSLDGLKFWLGGEKGSDSKWAELTFEPSASKEQREAIRTFLSHLFPFKWASFTMVPDAAISWSADVLRAEAKLENGRWGEIVLVRNPGAYDDGATVVKNLKYFGAARNDGYNMMPSELVAYKRGKKPFEYGKGSAGWTITVDTTSKDYTSTK